MRLVAVILGLILLSGAACASPPVMWEYRVKGSAYTDIVLDEGVVFFASTGGAVYGLNETTGQARWVYNSTAGVYSTPAVTGSRVIFGCDNNVVYALNKSSGNRMWTFLAGGKIHSSPSVSDGVVYIGSDDQHLYALNESTGKMLWSLSAKSTVQSNPLADEWRVYFGASDRTFNTISKATGKVLWNYTTRGLVSAAPAVSGDVVYITSSDKRVYAVDKYFGKEIWNYTTNGSIYGSPVVDQKGLIVASNDKRVYYLDKQNGSLQWSSFLNDSIYATPTVEEGIVYVGAGRMLNALNQSTGDIIWKKDLNATIKNRAAYHNGIIYVPAGSYVKALGGVADVEVVSVSADPPIPVQGRQYAIKVELRNKGNSLAANVNVSVYLDRRYEAADSVTIPADRTVTRYYAFNASYGKHLAEAIADRDNRLMESDKTNNLRAAVFTVSGDWPTFKNNFKRTGSLDLADNFSLPDRRIFWTCSLNSTEHGMGDLDSWVEMLNASGGRVKDVALAHNCYYYQSRGYPLGRIYSNWSCTPDYINGSTEGNFTAMLEYLSRFNETSYNLSKKHGLTHYPFNLTDFKMSFRCDATQNTELPVENATLFWECRVKRDFYPTPYNTTKSWSCTSRYYSNFSIQELVQLKGYLLQDRTNAPLGEGRFRDYGLLWNYTTKNAVKATPVVSDIDHDGALEVIAASTDGRVYALDSTGNLLWSYDSGSGIYSTPTISDIDGDGSPEVLFGSDDGRLYALNASGVRVWSFSTGRIVRSSPLVADLDAIPSDPEVVFGSMDERVYCLNSKGRLLWNYSTSESVVSSPAAVDIDSDGSLEVVVGSMDNIVYILKNPPYKLWTYQTRDDIANTPAVDSQKNIYIASGASLYRLYYSKTTDKEGISISRLSMKWVYNTTNDITTSPVFGFLDNDSSKDIVFAAGSDLIAINDSGGRIFRYSVSRPIQSTPAIGDFDGDGDGEIVFGSNEGILFILNSSGGRQWSYDLNCSIESSPALSDLGGNGALNVIVGCDDGRVYAFGSRSIMRKRDAISLYQAAMRQLDIGSLTNAREYALNASTAFAGLGDAGGLSNSSRVLNYINGYRMYLNAVDAYSEGNATDASGYANKAMLYFKMSNDTEMLARSKALKETADADLSLNEAERQYGLGEYKKAKEYADTAIRYYAGLNDTAKAGEAQHLAERSRKASMAHELYDKAGIMLKRGFLQKAGELMNNSTRIYADINNTAGVDKSSEMLLTINSKITYENANHLFKLGKHKEALKKAEQAAVMFLRAGMLNESDKALSLFSRAIAASEADMRLNQAISSLASSDCKAAANYSADALRLYRFSDIRYGIENASRFMNDSQTCAKQTPD